MENRKDKEDIDLYYNCKKLGHIIADCPTIKTTTSTSKKLYKKIAIKAIGII